ncbi:unnamed protein product [Mucor hiemalis]
MESLLNEASDELATRLSLQNVTLPTTTTIYNETQSCIKSVEETTALTTKVQSESEAITDTLTSLKNNYKDLQSTFDKIDQLELLVNKVKDTYNAVAENLDGIEKAVNASTSKRSDIPIQPYFPPPKPVEIFDTQELMSTHQ